MKKRWTEKEIDFLIQNQQLSIKELSEKLNRDYSSVSARIRRLNIRQKRTCEKIKIKNISKEKLQEIVSKSKSYTDLAKKLNIRNRYNFVSFIKSFNLDTSHFISEKYNKLIGTKINNLEILSKFTDKYTYLKMKCFCGTVFNALAYDIKREVTKSCGCITRKMISEKISGDKNKRWTGYEEIHGKYWSSLKSNAKTRKIEFNITIEDVWNQYLKQNRKCALSGLDISFKRITKSSKQTASVDRIDSSIGYTKNNIQIVFYKTNIMKQHYNEKEFIELCGLIANYRK